MQLRQLPTSELSLHPIAKALPPVNTDSPEFQALLTTIASIGCPRPVAVHSFRVVDGADVWEAAKHLGLKSVPCIEVAKDDITLHVVADFVARPHYTKGQRAYITWPLLDSILAASKNRRIANLKHALKPAEKGGDSSQTLENADSALSALSTDPLNIYATRLTGAKTVEDAADALGISRRLLFFARAIHKEFAEAPELREVFEPRILDHDEDGAMLGLGSVVAGIAGYKATKDRTPMIQPELELWRQRVSKVWDPRRWNAWDKATPETRDAVAEEFARQLFETCPEEVIRRVEFAAAKRLGVKAPLRTVERTA